VATFIEIHPQDPQPRRIAAIVQTIRDGGLIAYPTDSSYAFGCHIGDKGAMDRIRRIRRTDKKHNFTLVCSDLSEISVYARVDNWAFRMIKSMTPGPYTFILPATREVPKRLQNPKPGDDRPLTDPLEIDERIGHLIDMVIDAGPAGIEPTSVIDLSGGTAEVLRVGRGDLSGLVRA
jgi:tRNA A37 threonylcarbamoyladenosine synthetase subunit TsaC/SUA5/YrdC